MKVDSVKLFAELDGKGWVKIVIDSQKAQALYRFAYKTFHQLS
jgi:hypothetical protein